MSTARKFCQKTLVILAALQFNGCASLLSATTAELGDNLAKTVLNHNDPQTVLAGMPSYLLLQEALLRQQPDNPSLLLSAAALHRAYASLLPADNESRLAALSDKALDFSLRAACQQQSDFCALKQLSYPAFETVVQTSRPADLAVLYDVGASWALWIQAHKSDWNAVAQLAQVKAIMQQVLTQQPDYQQGAAHLYLAVLSSLLPTAMGGDLAAAKQHFEQALQGSQGKNLLIKVLYAKHYARMAFDRPLHDRLLNEVLASPVQQDDLTLMNTVAQQQARELLKSAATYF
jgi:hypothetical protein